MRTLNEHIVNPANDKLLIEVVDAPGAGGAHHEYVISWTHPDTETSGEALCINFQDGPIAEVGINGVTHEALLAVVADRLRCFQAGAYACKENACALTHIEEALHWLQQRTIARMRRGVEGTHSL